MMHLRKDYDILSTKRIENFKSLNNYEKKKEKYINH